MGRRASAARTLDHAASYILRDKAGDDHGGAQVAAELGYDAEKLERLLWQAARDPAKKAEVLEILTETLSGSSADLVFPTSTGAKDNRQNVRQRLLHKAIERANVKLAKLGIDPIGKVSPHGLRRTYAALRSAAGDDVAYTATQIGHEDPTFTLRVYTQAVKRRQRLSENELAEFNRALEWAQWARPTAPECQSIGHQRAQGGAVLPPPFPSALPLQ
jgi:Phage integrase family